MCIGYVKHQEICENQNMNILEVQNKTCSDNNIRYDLLSLLTYYTKIIICIFNQISKKFQKLPYFHLLMRTTQPAHLITFGCAVLLAKILSPHNCNAAEFNSPPTYMKLIYLASFAAHFGIQIWMTFVSGLTLYLCLPRHAFGNVQKILFPKYFLINAILSLITLCSFLQYQVHLNSGSEQNIQIILLVICFCIEMLIRLYMAPVLLRLITDKNLMEHAAGVGMEVGRQNIGPLVHCPTYMQLHSSFRKLHVTIAMGNMITMGCTAMHLYYLANRIEI